jgi:hypothetical protein
MKWYEWSTAVLAGALGVLALLAFGLGVRDEADAAAAQQAALDWTGATLTDAPRRDGDGWEVDVRRADGSLVEVTLGPRLELRELDEELGPGAAAAPDELTGRLRERAIAAARPRGGPGPVRSVESERDGSFEVDIVRPDETVIEVELDRHLRVADLDREEIGDE